jgi:HD superfamily phosphodiesterase
MDGQQRRGERGAAHNFRHALSVAKHTREVLEEEGYSNPGIGVVTGLVHDLYREAREVQELSDGQITAGLIAGVAGIEEQFVKDVSAVEGLSQDVVRQMVYIG